MYKKPSYDKPSNVTNFLKITKKLVKCNMESFVLNLYMVCMLFLLLLYRVNQAIKLLLYSLLRHKLKTATSIKIQ